MGSQAGEDQQVQRGFQIWSNQKLGMERTAAQTICQISWLETAPSVFIFKMSIKTMKKKQSAKQSRPTLAVRISNSRSNG